MFYSEVIYKFFTVLLSENQDSFGMLTHEKKECMGNKTHKK